MKFFGKHMAEEKMNMVGDLRWVIHFSNGYGVSIIPYESIYDASFDSKALEEKFEVAVLDDSGKRIEEPVHGLTEDGVAKFLDEVKAR